MPRKKTKKCNHKFHLARFNSSLYNRVVGNAIFICEKCGFTKEVNTHE